MREAIEYGQAGERTSATQVSMPAPTLFPLLLAFGLMFTFAGLIFNPYLSYLGVVVTLGAAVGWWSRVIPQEAHEAVRIDERHRPSPIVENPNAVARLKAGSDKHRLMVPEEAHPYSAGVVGGLTGGAAMAVLACLYGLIAQHTVSGFQ